ncbi:MAG TPA: lysophospholipid acyltransferase family protein [Polyangiaceae bacterium]
MIRVFGAVLGFVVGSLLRIRRAHVVEAMRRAGIARPADVASAMYAALGTSVLEFVALARPKVMLQAALDEDSRAKLDSAKALGRGIVFAASHTGNWEVAAYAIAREMKLLVVVKRLSVGFVDRFTKATRDRRGLQLCEGRGAIVHALAQLAEGGAVAMMIDQVPDRKSHAYPVPFLGQEAFVDRAPAALAARTGSPLVVSAARRAADGTQSLHVLDVIVPPEGADLEWTRRATARATRALEAFVVEHPSEWLWMHRRWRAPSA